MCGIFGHGGFGVDVAASRLALDSLRHRGPDQSGEWCDESVYLAQRRLSIIDLSENGRQPMLDDGRRAVMCVNGEIYNFQPLRAQLKGVHRFNSQSDSEVLLHGYLEWGMQGLLERIDGMFAFAIYDRRQRKIFLARDRVGIKPLYFHAAGGRLVWGSELKPLVEFLGESQIRLDLTAVYDYLTYSYIPTPKTLYQGIEKLEPAHFLEFDLLSGRLTKRRYWSLPVATRTIGIEEASAEARRLIALSVQQQMVSDVDVGFFLSGGLDSSIVVSEASRGRKISTYCIGFAGSQRDESAYAELVARRCNADHTAREVSPDDLAGCFGELRKWYDEPFADTSAIPTFAVCKLARERVKVVLSGDGGDELFGGYNWYRMFQRIGSGLAARLPGVRTAGARLTPAVRALRLHGLAYRLETRMLDELELFTRLKSGLLKEEKRRYALAFDIPGDYDDYWHYRQYLRADLPLLTRLQYLDFHCYLPDDVLTKVDRVSMAVALEVRVPLLSRELTEFAFQLPEHVRFHGEQLKGLLKHAYRGLLPDAILDRTKQGFGSPVTEWADRLGIPAGGYSQALLQRLFPEVWPGRIVPRASNV